MSKKITLFLIAVAVQSIILAAMPLSKIHTLKTGMEIRVQTVPVDPYDILSGYYVTLRYDFSNSNEVYLREGQRVYVVLQKDEEGIYRSRSFNDKWPVELQKNEMVLKGKAVNNWRGDFKFGIEKYYMPEGLREQINEQIRKWQGKGQVLVDLKVDKKGNPAIIRLIINGQLYEF